MIRIILILLILFVSLLGQSVSEKNQISPVQDLKSQINQHPDSLGLYVNYFRQKFNQLKTYDKLDSCYSELDQLFNSMRNSTSDSVTLYTVQFTILMTYNVFLNNAYREKMSVLNDQENENEMLDLKSKHIEKGMNIQNKYMNLCLKLKNRSTDPRINSMCKSILSYGEHLNFLKKMKSNPAPQFSTMDIKGAVISLDSFRGQYVLLHFWSMYSQPSIEKLNDLKKIYAKYSKYGFEIISINGDKMDTEMDKYVIRNFIDEMDLRWHHIAEGKNSRIMKLYYASAFNELYIIGPKGYIFKHHRELYDQNLDSLLSKIYLPN